ncbi:MAG TPA: LysR substrate-binding domain-containing protein [Geminicoccus sp.]|uniref:LysR substrate-binding domain-containing protein n=1 Tax=Geminicoccus sp. TaxID=2024832 RepID=UPI002E32BC13|nr:LysR substrate-binding domain-containing protein [Geminicoccus sp.]HEX2529156.1 LysR substrate-binding domain-containing protein [Geminicoccus sp.]
MFIIMLMRNLDLDQIRSFIAAADLRSFTAAGECLAATQSAISVRVAKLEHQLGKRLLARTPRAVALTEDGRLFLPWARRIVGTHDEALAAMDDLAADEPTLRLAVSDHATAGRLPSALQSLRNAQPRLVPDVVVGTSADMMAAYDVGAADAAIVRQDADRRDGIHLYEEPLVWIAADRLAERVNRPVDLVALRGQCDVKAAMTRALDERGLPWRIVFQGGSVTALQAAVEAGLGVTAVGRTHVPSRCAVLDDLPVMPASRVVMHTRLPAPMRDTLRAAFRQIGRPMS